MWGKRTKRTKYWEKGRKGRNIGKKDEKDEKTLISDSRSSVRSNATHSIGELKNVMEIFMQVLNQ